MDNEIRFLYSVYPKKPIKNLLPNGRPINSPKTLSLTKEEVLMCMKSGTVYRRFGSINRNERVTTMNLDRLHQRDFVTEEEWKKMEKPVEEAPVVETSVESIETPSEETTITPEVVEEPAKEEDNSNKESEEVAPVVEDEIKDSEEESTEEEPVEEDNNRGTVVNTEAEVVSEKDEEAEEESTKDNTSLNEFYARGYSKKKRKH